MKTRYIKVFLLFVILFLLKIHYSTAQDYSQNNVSSYCAVNTPSNNDMIFPLKPPVTGEHYMNIIIVYVMFNNETYLSGNNDQDWHIKTTRGPSWIGTMLAQAKNDIPDWWNAYDPETQSISSWFCENSRGKTHIIGDEFFVKLPLSAEQYMDINNFPNQIDREKAINSYIYEYLTNHYLVQWAQYDNWTYSTNSGWSWGPDGSIDMIYKVHRYNYYNPEREIFCTGKLSGINMLGYGRSSNSINDYDYIKAQNNISYHFIGANYFYTPNGEIRAGSGVTVVGNGTSGVLDKMGTLGRLLHENGHYFFGGDHSNLGMMGEVWDLSYSPWEKMMLGYISPVISNWQNNGFQEIILDDYYARTANGNFILDVETSDGREFLITHRNKVSRWDRIMNGDVAAFGLDTYHGKGVYIYHNCTNHYYHPNKNIDIECADGLWKWVQTGYDAPDWSPTNYVLPVLMRSEVVRFPNDQNDDGIGRNIKNPLYQNSAKDGLTVRGEGIPPQNEPIPILPKYFSKGKKGINGTNNGCGWDRIETNTDWENWTSRENSVDRWDAWRPGYNEIFSPYSSPSTIGWFNEPTGLFIWINENVNPLKINIQIFRDATYNFGGMSESDILAKTPPSRPMGIKETKCFYDGFYNRPQITWVHNMEPDMDRKIKNVHHKRYNIWKVKSNDMNTVPSENDYQFITGVEIPIYDTPTFIDTSEISNCYLPDDASCPPFCWIVYPIRYRVQAIDIYDMVSVKSDFVQILGMRRVNGKPLGSENDGLKEIRFNNNPIPETFDLKQNYPNPFNPETNIRYDLPNDISVSVKIYDLLGREIKTLVDELKYAGSYIVSFNGSEFASGIYFYRIKAGDFIQVKRMILIK